MKRQFSKLLPALAVIGSFFTYSCGDNDTPEGIKSQQKGDPCDQKNRCMTGLVCEGGICRVLCATKDDCGAKEHCENSRCVANLSDECSEGFGGKDGKDCNSCLKGYYGDLCEPCDCKHGECWDGKSGNGQCKSGSCSQGWDGPNCDKCADNYATENCVLPNCKNGTPNLGLEGDGHCSECIDDWSGTDCDTPNSCIHGTVDKGITGNGLCKGECDEGWTGDKCDKCADGWDGQNCDECAGDLSGEHCDLPNNCVNGTPNIGVKGNGKCSSCFDKWTGPNCDVCPAGFYDGVTDCVDCRKVTGSAFGTNKCTFTDIRKNSDKTEQNKYNVVTINGKFWLAENLKAKLDVNGNEINCYVNEGADQYFLEKYGCLYVWKELATLDGKTNEENTNRICPKGWRLPTKTDFDNLLTYANDNKTASDDFLSLIKNSTAWTNYSKDGVDDFGFGALPAGSYYSGNYSSFGGSGFFWSSTESDVSLAYYLYLGLGTAGGYYNDKTLGNSVRCLRD